MTLSTRSTQRSLTSFLTWRGALAAVGACAVFSQLGACSEPADDDTTTGGAGGTGGSAAVGGTTSGAGKGGSGPSTGGAGGAGGAGGSVGGSAGLGGAGGSIGGAGAAAGTAGHVSGGAGSGGTAGGRGGAGGSSGAAPGGNGGAAGAGAAGSGAGGPPNGGAGGRGGGMGGRGGNGAGGTAAGMAGGGGSAGGGGGDYHPCPTNGDPCKILPLGDSITWGIQYDGAYRVELFTKAVGDNKKITFTGSLSNGPSMVAGQTFPKANEGHSGWTIDQDAGLIPSPALTTIPNIVLLHIGTNDIYASSGQSTMPDRLGKLIDKIIAGAPDALVVVAKITPLSNTSWNATIKTYNDAIPGVVKTRADAGKHVINADMNTGFTSSMLSSDGVHPNKSGYDFMGDQWYSVIKSYLP